MEKYIKPGIEIIEIENEAPLCASATSNGPEIDDTAVEEFI